MITIIVMTCTTPIWIMFYIRERATGAKHLQFTSGINIFIFWFISFLCDLLIFVVISLCIVIAIVPFQVDGYKSADELGNNSVLIWYIKFHLLF